LNLFIYFYLNLFI